MDKEYSILVIDDEPLARLSFRKLIETRFPGFNVCGEAGTGPEGLEFFRRLQPDIVMMDIQIPDLNGLETSRLILERHPEAQIIILSAYDQFDYVQDALNTGILGYLLKPVNEKKLRQLLDKAVQRVKGFEDSIRDSIQLQNFREIAAGDMVTSFIYGSCGGLDADFYAGHHEPPVKSGYFLLFRIDDISTEEGTAKEISNYLKHLPGALPGRWIGSILPVFIFSSNSISPDTVFTEGISRRLSILTSRNVKTGMGGIQTHPSDFPLSFSQALDSLESGALHLNSAVLEYPRDLEKRFLRSAEEEQWERARDSINLFFEMLSMPACSLGNTQMILNEFLILFRRFMDDKGDRNSSHLISNLQRNIYLHHDRLSMLEWIASSLLDLLSVLEDSESSDDLQIRKVLKYIDLNDFQEISLETAAVSVGLTPQYLSRIFKDRYKMNFLEYLISRRMELACRLLKETGLSIKEIALKSGYNDVNYFGRVFKKQMAVSPREYRLKY